MKLSIRSISHNIVLAYDLFTNRRYSEIEPLSVKSHIIDRNSTITNEAIYDEPIFVYSGIFYHNYIYNMFSRRREINLKCPHTSVFKRGVKIRFYGKDL